MTSLPINFNFLQVLSSANRFNSFITECYIEHILLFSFTALKALKIESSVVKDIVEFVHPFKILTIITFSHKSNGYQNSTQWVLLTEF